MRGLSGIVCALAVFLAIGPSAAHGIEPSPFWGGAGELAMSPDGRHLYAAGGGNTLSFRRDAATGGLVAIGQSEPGGYSLVLSPDGAYAYVGTNGDRIHVLSREPASGLLTHELTFHSRLQDTQDLAMAPDGRHLYAASLYQDSVAVLSRDSVTGVLTRTGAVFGGPGASDVQWLDAPRALAASPDGRALYVATNSGLGGLRRDPVTGNLRPFDDPPGGGAQGFAVAVSPDGSRVYSANGAYNADLTAASDPPAEHAPGEERPGCTVPFGCYLQRTISVSPDGAAVIRGFPNEKTLQMTREGGVTFYTDGRRGVRGLDGPVDSVWSPDGAHLYTVAEAQPNFPFCCSNGRAVFGVFARTSGQVRLSQVASSPFVLRPVPEKQAAITINRGASFTNSARIEVTVTPPSGETTFEPASLRLSNDGVFQGRAIRLSGNDRYSWTLRDTGLGRDVRRVHVRFTSTEEQGAVPRGDLSDDIVLDQRPPVLSSALLALPPKARRTRAAPSSRARRFRVRIRARDNRSGVRRMQITTRRSRPGAQRRFRGVTALKRKPKRLYVRVFDGAGNRSEWRRVKRAARRR